jgi:hypothetical protein
LLYEEIENFLAAEPEAEPVYQVATTWNANSPWIDVDEVQFNTAHQAKRIVYLHPPRPEPARKPITPDEIKEQPIGLLHPNGRFELIGDELPMHLSFPVKLYARDHDA